MSYDPNRLMGLDALSPTIGAYKQFVERQNNVGDPNVVQFLASRGEPQLAGLIAKKMRVENAAKSQQALAQQPPAAPPTVADQYDQAAQQQAQQAMAAQMAQMQQARMAQAAPGLAGMPNPAMEQANFAGGGIVAFAGGGDVQHFANQGLVGGIPSAWSGAAPYSTYSPEEKEKFALSAVGGVVPESLTPEEVEVIKKYASSAMAQHGGGFVLPEDETLLRTAQRKAAALHTYKKLGGSREASTSDDTSAAPTIPTPAGGQAIPSGTPTLAELKNKYAVKPPAPTGGIGSLVKPPVTTTTKATAPAAPPATATAAATPAFTNPYKELADEVARPEDQYIKEAIERNKKLGAGAAADEFEKVISKLKDRYEGAGADKANMKQAIVQFGAALMAGKGGFNAALGQAAQAGVGQYYAGKKENEKAAMELAKSTFELHQAKENLMLSAAKEGSAEFKKKEEDIKSAKLKQAEAQFEMDKLNQQAQNRMAEIDKQAKADMARTKYEQEKMGERTEVMYGDKADITRLNNIATRAENFLKSDFASIHPNDPAVVQAKQDFQYAVNALKGQGGVGGTVSPEVQALLNKYK